MSDNEAVVRCSRCEDIPIPGSLSTKRQCNKCGRDVWLAAAISAAISKRYPKATVITVCMKCVGLDDQKVVNLPEHVDFLRSCGDSDDVIAYKLAIAEVAAGSATLEEAQEEIRGFPQGVKARAFPDALRRASLLVRATRIPRN